MSSSSSESKPLDLQIRGTRAKRKKEHHLILSKRGWADHRVMTPEGVYVSIASVVPKDRPAELRIAVIGEDGSELVPATYVPFYDLAKILHVGPEDLVSGEWARIFGDDWRYYFRSPKQCYSRFVRWSREQSHDPEELGRRAVIFMINLIESMGYARLGQQVRAIVKRGLGIKTKHLYHRI